MLTIAAGLVLGYLGILLVAKVVNSGLLWPFAKHFSLVFFGGIGLLSVFVVRTGGRNTTIAPTSILLTCVAILAVAVLSGAGAAYLTSRGIPINDD